MRIINKGRGFRHRLKAPTVRALLSSRVNLTLEMEKDHFFFFPMIIFRRQFHHCSAVTKHRNLCSIFGQDVLWEELTNTGEKLI